jgi:hypothetical protein
MSKNKNAISIALILLLTVSAAITGTAVQFGANAQVIDIPTFLFVIASPNPVGVGQIVYVGATFSRPTPTGSGYSGDLYEDVTVDIIDPSGHKAVYGPYLMSPVAGVTFTFTPDVAGDYTLQAHYPGQVLTGDNPESSARSNMNSHLIGSKMLSDDSDTITLVVQDEPVEPIYKTPPLPTEFWTRSIYGTNWNWGELGSNWFGLSGGAGFSSGGSGAGGDTYNRNFQPYGPAPNTPHIMWTMPTQLGGQPGMPVPADESSMYSGTSLLITYFKPVCILNGVLFYNKFAYTGTFMGWRAVDIHTGKILWEKTADEVENQYLDWGQVFNYNNFQEFGSAALLYTTVSGGMFRIYDPLTGQYLANVTNTLSTSRVINYDNNYGSASLRGEVLGYYTSGGNLCMYNYTKLLQGTSWRVRVSGNIDASSSQYDAVMWETPLPTTFNGDGISLGIASADDDVILMSQVPGGVSWQGTNPGFIYLAGYDAKTGDRLWGPINQTLPKYEDTSLLCAADGYFVMHNKDRNLAWGYSLTTGEQLWGPVQLEGGGVSSVFRAGIIGYGRVYISDLGGYVNAIDLETGEVAWTYFAGSAGYDTPFESYPIFGYNTQSMADGLLFLTEGIMYTPPAHPSYRLAINCNDGSLVWKLLQYACTCVGPIADGFLISWDSFDTSIYCIGKGPSATTVTAPDTAQPLGTQVLVQGTVIDTSGGTTQDVITTRFPNGLPAVSDDSMEAWMEYAYQQQIKPTNATGVKVTISVLDPNGNSYDIGTTTSNTDGKYGVTFTPQVPGKYTIIATFAGSESYYSSHASTYMSVTEAPAATVSPTPPPASTADLYFVPGIAGIVIAIAVVGAVIILMLRKR